MTRIDTSAWLHAVATHLDTHRDLTVASVSGYRPHIQTGGSLADLAAWARSMLGVSPIVVVAVVGDNNPYTHLAFTGHLTDDTFATVTTCIHTDESDLLAANVALAEGVEIGVYDLLKLVDHTVAEQVAQ